MALIHKASQRPAGKQLVSSAHSTAVEVQQSSDVEHASDASSADERMPLPAEVPLQPEGQAADSGVGAKFHGVQQGSEDLHKGTQQSGSEEHAATRVYEIDEPQQRSDDAHNASWQPSGPDPASKTASERMRLRLETELPQRPAGQPLASASHGAAHVVKERGQDARKGLQKCSGDEHGTLQPTQTSDDSWLQAELPQHSQGKVVTSAAWEADGGQQDSKHSHETLQQGGKNSLKISQQSGDSERTSEAGSGDWWNLLDAEPPEVLEGQPPATATYSRDAVGDPRLSGAARGNHVAADPWP